MIEGTDLHWGTFNSLEGIQGGVLSVLLSHL